MAEPATPSQKLLLIDDDPALHAAVGNALRKERYEVISAYTAQQGSALLQNDHFELILLDLNLPDANGMEWLSSIRAHVDSEVPVVVVTGRDTVRGAVEALQAGAQDFVTKPFGAAELRAVIHRTLCVTELQRDLRAARRQSALKGVSEAIAADPSMQEVLRLVLRVAGSPQSTVLILGETGVGKGLVARALHNASARRAQPFLTINCAALPTELVEAELFGADKGAFTDAVKSRPGLVEEAAGGTLFLDEVPRMSLAVQAKLLTLLEERTLRRLGSSREHPVDVRVIAATNADLAAAVATGDFRADLYYRLNVITIRIPPLRERLLDISVLAQHFLSTLGPELGRSGLRFAPETLAAMRAHPWPGNVRELRNCVERSVLLCAGTTITPADLGLLSGPVPAETDPPVTPAAGSPTGSDSSHQEERRHVLEVLRQCGGNRRLAAAQLGIARETLQRRLRKWGLVGTESGDVE